MKRHSSRRVYVWTLPLVALVCLLLAQAKANAVPVVGLTVTDRLVFFDSEAPAAVSALVSITGLPAGEHILGIDFRPLTGQIYALGSASRLYTLNPVTGAATQVGSGTFTPLLNGIEFGVDFDPTTDRLRVVSNTGQNLRLDPDTGAVISADSALIFAPGEPQSGMQPDITGVAYTNNFKGATTSTLYAVDWRRGQLQRIGSPGGSPVSPNTGQVFTVGTLGTGFQVTEMVGFDIAANSGTGYAALRSGDALSGSFFYTINLLTGAAAQQGQIGGGEFIRDVTVIDRAVDLLAITASKRLLRFNSGTPGAIINAVNITNLQSANEQIIGLDYLDDQFLYIVTDANRIYSLNATSGVATFVGEFLVSLLNGTNFGLTTTPQNYIQAVSDTEQNLLISPYTAVGSALRSPLAFAAADQHAGQNPNVVGAAFTHGKPAAATMFDIDSNLDILVQQGAADGNPLSFESGQLYTLGPLGVDTTSMVGFDIEQTPLLCPCNNTALRTGATFASLTAPGDMVSKLYAINLKTGGASLLGIIGGGEVIRDIAVVQIIGLVGFSQPSFSGSEGDGSIPISVTRSGDINVAASVDYETSDSGARQAQDYTYSSGTLYFAPGETSKTIEIPVIDDGLTGEGVIGEFFYVRLSNPTAGFGVDPGVVRFFGGGTAEIRIIDNDTTDSTTNPADDTDFFVRQHYRDFLNRDADDAGLTFWKNEITSCGADAGCVERKRINVSAAFFLSIEFQNTGFLVHRLYETSFNRIPSYREFMQGSQKIGRGIVVGESDWEAKLEAKKQAFLNEWVNCQTFREAFDEKSNADYVDALFANAKLVPLESHRQALISDLNNHVKTRADVLRAVAEDPILISAQTNRAFVLMQYFGYLRRNPNDPPDSDFSGYNFWLAKLDQFNGNFVNAEMVKAFILSGEYRQRFGP